MRSIEMPEFSPSQKAYFALEALNQAPELQHDRVIGGRTPHHILEENKRKDEVRRVRRLEIIAEYGVADEYLEPLLEQEQRLQKQLAAVQRQIADLKELSKP